MWARIVIALGADKTPLHARSRPTTCREQVRFGSLDRRLEVATLNSTPAGRGRGGTLQAALRKSRAARRHQFGRKTRKYLLGRNLCSDASAQPARPTFLFT